MSSDSQQLTRSLAVDRPLVTDPAEMLGDVTDVLGRKWHLRIVYYLLEDGPMGFSSLKDRLDGVSSKMLSESLSSLDDQGLVDREIVSDQPVRVEYSLTEAGAALDSVVAELIDWNAAAARSPMEDKR